MPPSAPSLGHPPSINFDSTDNDNHHHHAGSGHHDISNVAVGPAAKFAAETTPSGSRVLPYDNINAGSCTMTIPHGAGPENYLSGLMGPPSIYSPSPYAGYGGGMPYTGGGTGGSGLLYGAGTGGLYGGGYGGGAGLGMFGGGFGGGMMAGGPLSNLNQLLFGIQNVIFSLTQAVQIIGMNTEAVQKLLEAATAMFDHAIGTWKEMKALEDAARETETEDDRKRRRRLRALRWAFTTAVAYAAYAMVRHVLSLSSSWRKNQLHYNQHPQIMQQPGSSVAYR